MTPETPNTLEAHWMPFTDNRAFKRSPRLMVSAEGVWYRDTRGKRYFDGCSGLFTTPAGHGRRAIADAVHQQLMSCDYISHFNVGHPASFVLAERLSEILPAGLERIFLVNSGSEAVDTALKIIQAYHHARGDNLRSRFVSRGRAYHGVGLAGTSLSGMVRNRRGYTALIPNVLHMRHTWSGEVRYCKGQPDDPVALARAEDLQVFIDLYGADSIAACFVEPVAGSTGALVPPKGYLERIREICTQNDILLVFDEVITGFGRLGAPFAAQAFGVMPDVITMAKAIANGVQPLGAVAVRREIYDTVLASAPESSVEFFHGYTYSGHPASCAAALACQKIYQEENLFARAAELSGPFLDGLLSLQGIPAVTDIRGMGLLGGIDIEPYPGRPGVRGMEAQEKLYIEGVHVKVTGDTVLVAPPFVASEDELAGMTAALGRALRAL